MTGEHTSEPLLALSSARIVAGGVVLADALSLTLAGPRVMLTGNTSALLRPLMRGATVEHGSFLVLGEPLSASVIDHIGLAPHDPPLPLLLTPIDYAFWGARLAGVDEAEARERAIKVCSLAGLGDWATRPFSLLSLVLRRMAVLAQAAVLEPLLLVAELPLEGLDAAAGAYVLGTLGRLCADRGAMVSASRPLPGSPGASLAAGSDEIVELEGSRVVAVHHPRANQAPAASLVPDGTSLSPEPSPTLQPPPEAPEVAPPEAPEVVQARAAHGEAAGEGGASGG